MADYKTKAPSGLKFTRKGNAVTLNWKISDSNYDSGQYFYRNIYSWKQVYKNVKVKKKTVKKLVGETSSDHYEGYINNKATSANITINPKKYYPYKKVYLTTISAAVQGKRSNFEENDTNYYPSWSNITKLKKEISKPRPPKVSASLSNTNENVTTFSWAKQDDNTSFNWFTDYERETILVKDCNTKDGTKLSW